MDITKIIDHTNLKADALPEDILKLCREAKEFGFRGVCLHLKWVNLAKKELQGSLIKVVSVIDFPLAGSGREARLFLAKKARESGADEIDPVLDIGNFKAGNLDYVLEDLKGLASVLPAKVIIETGYLSDEEIKKASLLVKEAGCYCVKTSTGLEPKVELSKKLEQVALMRETVGKDFPIKAAGGIKTLSDLEKIVEAGATIIGTSSGKEIVSGS